VEFGVLADRGMIWQEHRAKYEQAAAQCKLVREAYTLAQQAAGGHSAPASTEITLEAAAKFDDIDENGSGLLEGEETARLAEWTWGRFHPGESFDQTHVRDQAGSCIPFNAPV